MSLSQSILSTDTEWSFLTAILLILAYNFPSWSQIRWKRPLKQPHQQTPPKQILTTQKSARRVSFVSPPTDTTEVSEETEMSEVSFDHEDNIKEVYHKLPLSPVSIPQAATRPVKFVGQSIPLANIPESTCPALNSALKLKDKLLRQNAACSQSVCSGSERSTSKAHHRRSYTTATLPAPPLRPTPTQLRRYRSVDQEGQVSREAKHDSFLLERLRLELES